MSKIQQQVVHVTAGGPRTSRVFLGTLTEVTASVLDDRLGTNNVFEVEILATGKHLRRIVALTWDPAPSALNAGASVSKAITVYGVRLGDNITAAPTTDHGNLIVTARASSTNIVTITVYNPTAGQLTPATTWKIHHVKGDVV